VIGGANIYKYFLDNSLVDKLYLTKIFKSYNCDTYFPKLNLIPQYLNLIRSSAILTTKNKEISYQFREYTPYKHPNLYELNSIIR
jgi:dihydrofolate reductase